MRQITGGDALFLYADKQSRHQHISVLYFYDQSQVKGGPLRFKAILDHVERRLGRSPFFRQRLVEVPFNLDYPYWINDPDFDLEFHVRHLALPQPGDWRQLCIQLSRLHSRPLDLTRPVWEMYVIEGLNNIDFLPPGSFAIMLKVHHVAIDGVAAAEMTMGLHDLEPSPGTERRQVRWRPEPEPRPLELLARAARNKIRASLRTGRSLAHTLQRSINDAVSGGEAHKRPEEMAPHTRFNQEISPNRVWDAAIFELEDFKAIKNAVPGATINDVVLTICGGAMRRYLEAKNESPDSSLTSMVPVSVRSGDESGTGGNKVVLTRTSLKTQERDPVKRLAAVCQEMQHVKELNALGAREMMEMQEGLPAPTLLLASRVIAANAGPGKHYRAQHNMIVTNVPGPQQPLYFCGARLALFTGMAVILDNLAISHAVTSYDGKLVIAPLSDRAVMPDPAFYADCLREAFTELKSAAITASGKKTASTKTTGRRQKTVKAKTGPRKRNTRGQTGGRSASR
jgi:diacylglycerol O-acyltransferase